MLVTLRCCSRTVSSVQWAVRDFQRNIVKSTKGKLLNVIDGSERLNPVVEVLVDSQDLSAEVESGLGLEGEVKGVFVCSFVCQHDKELCIFSHAG